MIKQIQNQKNLVKEYLPVNYETRRNQLISLQKAIKRHENAIYKALDDDLRKDEWEVFVTELGIVYEELHHAIKNLKKWTKRKRIKTPLVQFPAKNYVISEAYGQVLIMSPWNYPLQLTFVPLIGALAAGNLVVIKPSAYAPEIAKVMQRIVQEVFVNNEVLLFLGGRSVNEQILSQHYDMIFFTGSPGVGKVVMRHASETLTPVVLELGGKSPFIITDDAPFPLTAQRLKFAKMINNGQTCVAPDYVLLAKSQLHRFAELEAIFNLSVAESKRIPKIVNEKHYLRLKSYLDEVGVKTYDDVTQTIKPTLVLNPDPTSQLMHEEIFGPILPVIVYDTLDEAIAFINERPKPLALYLFTTKKVTIDSVLTRTSSGSMAINDAVIQLANVHFPFGGVGNSGMGQYHGKHSFLTFSHQKPILHKSRYFDFAFRYKPGANTVKMFKKLTRNK